MASFPSDIYTEPDPDADTLANLGPLRPMAGSWESVAGKDEHPVVEGTEQNEFIESYNLQPIDPQTNGPQLFYGLRYHTHIVKPGEVETFHDQVGYWLWEPATGTVVMSLAIPRGQVVLASGHAAPDAKTFAVTAKLGDPTYGICSNPFLNDAFRTVNFRMSVSIESDAAWSYEEDTILEVRGRPEPFHHTDRNSLARVGPPIPNPMAAGRR
jgi:hypothetical protein